MRLDRRSDDSSTAKRVQPNMVPVGCEFIFHKDGSPLSYRQIQHKYNQALEKAGLSEDFKSTHILRHAMATITRRVTGSTDATQAVTGHKNIRMVEHYASLPTGLQKQAVSAVERSLMLGSTFGTQMGARPQLRLIQ